jgi:hypothetical protein
MAKEQVLGFQPAARLEQIDDEHSKRVQDCEDRSQSCDDSTYDANPGRMEFSERTGSGSQPRLGFGVTLMLAAIIAARNKNPATAAKASEKLPVTPFTNPISHGPIRPPN